MANLELEFLLSSKQRCFEGRSLGNDGRGAAKMSFTILGFYTAVSTNRTGAHIRTNKFSFAGIPPLKNDFGPQKS